ncbi:hypothetical protein [Adlercreutzia equolifaciens]|uniref:hypothetical protein n=1 Tax=Adlercreutzia equolifaciens TaxID=446660 RepID=UPI00038988ED|nr:hypothetical protein [Adlercreutzia equolifaciens]BAN76338.1 conserved hypothetical protein [Adlercreutzia equolifaciens DSM 19450]
MISLDPRSTSSAQDNTGKASAPIVQNDSQLNSDSTDQSATNRKIGKDSASPQKVPRRVTAATWVVRLCFAFVFVVNVQCALGFALAPEAYMGAYELGGVPGRVATQGIGIAFLMWNCTYPLVIWRPERHRTLASVVLAQQVVGLVGESLIRATLPAGHDLLASSIDLFIAFDAIGLVLMAASWGIFFLLEKRTCARIHA